MRHAPALLLGLLACALLGCVSGQSRRTSTWLDRLLQPAGPTGPDVVQMDLALVERSFGDRYINRDLWTYADEQVVSLESKALVEDNGFRIGQIGGLMPVGLQTLLTSEVSCANPRRLRRKVGEPTRVVLGPEMPLCSFQLQRDGVATTTTVEQGQYSLEIQTSLTSDGRTRLRFVPQILHGETNLRPRPADDLSGWVLKEEQPTERYPQLAFEVTLAPNEYVLVGGRFDKPTTLGHECFLRRDEPTPVQRLLVIRTTRPGKELDTDATLAAGGTTPHRSSAIASQASQATVRGVSP